KVGAQVMLVKNIIQGLLVNGSVGRVVGFYRPRGALAMGIEIAMPDRRERSGPDVPDIPGGPEQLLRINSVWPAVEFQAGPTMLCVPLPFEVVSAEGTTEATRLQVGWQAFIVAELRAAELTDRIDDIRSL
ncbi:hypothetical protein BD413DRAFT_479193, partial [Trametes elegans]